MKNKENVFDENQEDFLNLSVDIPNMSTFGSNDTKLNDNTNGSISEGFMCKINTNNETDQSRDKVITYVYKVKGFGVTHYDLLRKLILEHQKIIISTPYINRNNAFTDKNTGIFNIEYFIGYFSFTTEERINISNKEITIINPGGKNHFFNFLKNQVTCEDNSKLVHSDLIGKFSNSINLNGNSKFTHSKLYIFKKPIVDLKITNQNLNDKILITSANFSQSGIGKQTFEIGSVSGNYEFGVLISLQNNETNIIEYNLVDINDEAVVNMINETKEKISNLKKIDDIKKVISNYVNKYFESKEIMKDDTELFVEFPKKNNFRQKDITDNNFRYKEAKKWINSDDQLNKQMKILKYYFYKNPTNGDEE